MSQWREYENKRGNKVWAVKLTKPHEVANQFGEPGDFLIRERLTRKALWWIIKPGYFEACFKPVEEE